MDRRAFVALVGASILAPTLAAAQQTGKVPRIGYLVLAPLSDTPSPERAAFLAGLRDLGWIEGKTITIEYRSANWNAALLDDLGEELVRTKVDIIVGAGGGPAIRAAKRATSTIPIVMTGSADPVAEGLVASMARPGGNVTGMSSMITELGSKRLELLKETVPRVARLAVLLEIHTFIVRRAGDLAAAFLGMKKNHDLVVMSPAFMFVHRRASSILRPRTGSQPSLSSECLLSRVG